MNRDAIRAADGLVYYFRILFENQGLRWDSDNEVEIRFIIDDLMDAVENKMRDAIDKHTQPQAHG